MKILWFTNTPSLYNNAKTNYNGGGWIESLEQIVSNEENVELAISFFHTDSCFKKKERNTTYYPISLYNTKLKKIRHNLFFSKFEKKEVEYFLKIIDDFKPDMIHVFGSESSFGLITKYVQIPVIIHIQGILNPYLNAYFAPNRSMLDQIKQKILKPWKLIVLLKTFSFFKHNVKREAEILKDCKFFMGRTLWDKDVTSLYSPKAKYFYCSEVLRDVFYSSMHWELKNNEKFMVVSTISQASYKGFDLILKTAKLLKEVSILDFEWHVFGINEYSEWEKNLGIKCNEVNVHLRGIANSNELVSNLLNADIFIHPSYIDNSPNSVCEAQILGVPIISTNVGGISSLIKDRFNGYLIPSNDPFTLASRIIEIKANPDVAIKISANARKTALNRHDKNTIKNDLLNIYNELKNANSNY